MLKNKFLAAALLVGSAFLSAHAAAQVSYFGGSVGRAKWNFDCAGATSCHTAAGSWKLFGGHDFSPNFGVEGSYIYLNEVGLSDPMLKATFNGRGADLAGIAKTTAMNNFVGFAKLGVAFMKGEAIVQGSGVSGSETHYSSQPLIGLGVMYYIDKKMSIRAEVDHRNVKVTGFRDTTSGVTNFSIGLQSEF
ncbi:outer membrane beta-barrel protein [Undibacterium sp. Ji22W]|uniref:outer membrane beta-barrel protein n=1 Tax=Undibacterium sp. Ji22W TaxID=3413038 RepID=UPI003BF1E7B3